MNTELFNRLNEELKNLTELVNKAKNFILNKTEFDKLDYLNKDLLIAQFKAMETYQSVLAIRIGLMAGGNEIVDTEEEIVPETVGD